jgi:mono/diheme cytochrome c family protein
MRLRIPLSWLLTLALVSAAGLASRQRTIEHPQIQPTFSADVVRIFQENCQSCHHPGGLGTFSLVQYGDASPKAKDIRSKVLSGEMPPWKPVDGCGSFNGARRLTPSEIDTIVRWVDAGAPEGDPAMLPTELTFLSEWRLGPPDQESALEVSYTPPADRDMFRCFVLPISFPEDRYLSAVDFMPEARESVHHIIAYVDTTGSAAALDKADPEPGYESFGGPGFTAAALLGGWFPGADAPILPQGVAMKLPANARIVLQIHYSPHSAAPSPDQTKIGLYFSKTPVRQIFRFMAVENRDFTVPAGDPDYVVSKSSTLPFDIHVLTAGTHMHWLATRNQLDAILPDGSSTCLLRIDQWDPHWQGMYTLREPLPLPSGTEIHLEAHYDNTDSNLHNPNYPAKPVSYGEEANNEMCIGYLGYTIDNENLQ